MSSPTTPSFPLVMLAHALMGAALVLALMGWYGPATVTAVAAAVAWTWLAIAPVRSAPPCGYCSGRTNGDWLCDPCIDRGVQEWWS